MVDAKVVINVGEKTLCFEVPERGEPEHLGLEVARIIATLDGLERDTGASLIGRLMNEASQPLQVRSVSSNPNSFDTAFTYTFHALPAVGGGRRFSVQVNRRGDEFFSGTLREFVASVNPWAEGTMSFERAHRLQDLLGDVPDFCGRLRRKIEAELASTFAGDAALFRTEVQHSQGNVVVSVAASHAHCFDRVRTTAQREETLRIHTGLLCVFETCGLAEVRLDGGNLSGAVGGAAIFEGGAPMWRGGDPDHLELSNAVPGWRGTVSLERLKEDRRIILVQGRNAARFVVEGMAIADAQRLVEWRMLGIRR